MCNKVRDLVYSDRRIKLEEIANALHCSHGSVSTTLHDRLGMHKLTARWVPKSLSDEQMAWFPFTSGDCRWDLGPLLWAREQSSKSPECRSGVSEAKEVQNATLCWQGDGSCILGCTRCYYGGLSSKEKYSNRCVLCKFARLTENCDPWKTPR